MKKHLQCGLTAALTLALLLTACGQKEADANDTPPDAQAGSLYEDFFTGDVTVTANLINAGVEATTASFRAPAVYAKRQSMQRRAKKAAVRKAQKKSMVDELLGSGGDVHYGQRVGQEEHKKKELI